MKFFGFHRGFSNWIATFEVADRWFVAYFDRPSRHWRGMHEMKLSQEQVASIDKDLTERLRVWVGQKSVTEKRFDGESDPSSKE